MRKRLVITSLISIILICILFIGSTYSLFTTQDIDENANVYKTGNLDISYITSSDNLTINNSNPLTDEESKKISPYRITVTNKGNVAYKFNLLLTDTSTGRTIDYEYIKVQVGKLTPVTLKSCQDNIIKKDIVVLPNKSVDIDVRLWLADNIKNSEIGKSFYAKLSISGIAVDDNKEVDNQNLVADKISRATTYLKEIYENNSTITKVDIGLTKTETIYQNAEEGILLDSNGNYRYYGTNPNNYITLNNKIYRIIGSFKTKKDENSTNSNYRLKIIDNDYLNEIPYSLTSNDFTASELVDHLNREYYSKFNKVTKKLIDSVIYNISSSSETNYANDSYIQEQSGEVYECSDDNCGGVRNTIWNGSIAIMNLSDYLYATNTSLCNLPANQYDSTLCSSNNWLKGEDEFTITPSRTNPTKVLGIISGKIEETDAKLKYRPVFYLKPDTKLISGNGTIDNPYTVE